MKPSMLFRNILCSIALFNLTGCPFNSETSCSGTSGAGTKQRIESIATLFTMRTDDDYHDRLSPIELDIKSTHKLESINLLVKNPIENSFSTRFNVRFSIISQARACSRVEQALESNVQSIRIFIKTTSNENIAAGLEITDKFIVLNSNRSYIEQPLLTWNQAGNVNFDIHDAINLAVLSFSESESLAPAIYEFSILA